MTGGCAAPLARLLHRSVPIRPICLHERKFARRLQIGTRHPKVVCVHRISFPVGREKQPLEEAVIELGEQLWAEPPPGRQIIHEDTRPRRRLLRRRRRERVRGFPQPPRHSPRWATAQVATHREATVEPPETRCT